MITPNVCNSATAVLCSEAVLHLKAEGRRLHGGRCYGDLINTSCVSNDTEQVGPGFQNPKSFAISWFDLDQTP